MASEGAEKTEPPTPRRQQEARQRGQVPKSADLSAAVLMLVALVTGALFGPQAWRVLLAMVRDALSADDATNRGDMIRFALAGAQSGFRIVGPLLAMLFVAALAVMFAQVGFLLTVRPITPDLSKINPLSGIKRIFSPQTLVTTLINVGKLVVVAAVAYFTVSAWMGPIVHAARMDHAVVFSMAGSLVFGLGVRLALVMLVLAVLDYIYQRYRHNRDLRMTKEEVKDELRQMEGDPMMKRRRREVQERLARQRLMVEVPKADVVVTNPTHLAVALRYNADTMSAPRVVAKGADLLAWRIRQIAAAAGVPIVERKTLVRAMYYAVDVGQEIPERFYRAVAEVLAYVYDLTGMSHARSPAVPAGV